MLKKLTGMVLGIILTGAMVFAPFFVSEAYASTDEQFNIDSASNYYVQKYKSGDCVLSANAYMIMRAAYFGGSELFLDITNNLIRPVACTSPTGSAMKFGYDFAHDGATYTVIHEYLSGDEDKREEKVKELLEQHPEGVVVRGPSQSGGHGVLITEYKKGVFYAVDSAQNKDGRNYGIIPFGKTTMYGVGKCTQMWYIQSITGEPATSIHQLKVKNPVISEAADGYRITWDNGDPSISYDGYVIHYITKDELNAGGKWQVYDRTKDEYLDVSDFGDDTGYYFRIRAYRKNESKTLYSKYTRTYIRMSDGSAKVEEKIRLIDAPKTNIRETALVPKEKKE